MTRQPPSFFPCQGSSSGDPQRTMIHLPLLEAHDIQRQDHARQASEKARTRLLFGAIVFFCGFIIIGWRLVDLALLHPHNISSLARTDPVIPPQQQRADITDRNGVLLATSLPVESLYANPRKVIDLDQTIAKIRSIFPDLKPQYLRKILGSGGRFVWIKRGLTPRQADSINRLGIPGLYFKREERRLYPQGHLTAHVTGFTDIDQSGLAGIEAGLDHRLKTDPQPLALSLDVRLQHILRQEMMATLEKHAAKGAAGLVLDIHNGALLALVSLPDFDPNNRASMDPNHLFNRVTLAVYEMGSTLKPFTLATALDKGVVDLTDQYDARQPIEVSRFSIEDYHSMEKWLSVPEILIHSSNIGAAKIALDIGEERQRHFLESAGLLQRPELELIEVGAPIAPDPWRDVSVMTVGFGHGLAISAVQLASGIAALTNGGILRPATLLHHLHHRHSGAPSETPSQSGQAPLTETELAHPQLIPPQFKRLISEKTSRTIRALMRAVVQQGTAKKADISGYGVSGKTGTAEKAHTSGYQKRSLVSSFVGVFPHNEPRYLVLTLFDEPTGTRDTFNHATGGWIAAPTAGRVIARIGPVLGVETAPDDEEDTLPPTHLTTRDEETIFASF